MAFHNTHTNATRNTANLARGSALDDAIKKAIFCASQSVTRSGAQTSYCKLADVDEEFRPPPATSTHITHEQIQKIFLQLQLMLQL